MTDAPSRPAPVRAAPGPGGPAAVGLDDLVATTAGVLMAADSTTVASAGQEALRAVVTALGVDLGFLRFHDPVRRTSVLVAEYPPREHVPDPDPMGVVAFETADPVFRASEHMTDVVLVRPDRTSAGYQARVREASGQPEVSVASVPLRSGSDTTGVLGLIKHGDRGWAEEEVRALRTIASLTAQLQARVAAEERLRHLAHHDELTGLPNRRALLAHLHDVLDAEPAEPRALFFVDVDRLKAMNDLFGHAAGDQFLTAVARRLQSAAGREDLLARLGGDEFVLALHGPASPGRADSVAHRLQDALREPIILGGQSLRRTVSVGVAFSQPGCRAVSGWLRDADQAVLAAKAAGGDTVVTFTGALRVAQERRTTLEVDLAGALRQAGRGSGGLHLVHQPVVDLRTGAVRGVEALLRWDHPTLGAVSPEELVTVAEATNQAGPLGRWVLTGACRQLAAWRAALPGSATAAALTMAVNVTPVQLLAADFADVVAATLDEHGLTGDDLVLEVTEHAVINNDDATRTTLHALRDLGVVLAIDDFGTGYSSLAQLKNLPVGILKIDRGFVEHLGENRDDLAIVTSIVALARAFGHDLVAEGVQTEQAVETLLTLGCTRAQGYLFHRPLPAHAVQALLAGG